MEIIVVTAVWTLFACSLFCYVISVRRSEPMSVEEAKIIWKMHKQSSHCPGKKWQPISQKGNRIKGFRCECGYRYTQKRPLVSVTHKIVHRNYWDSLEI